MLAKQTLKHVAFRINQLKQNLKSHSGKEGTEPSENEPTGLTNCLEENSLFEAYLDKLSSRSQAPNKKICDKLSKIYNDIDNFRLTNGRLPLKANMTEFYRTLQFKTPHLAELANVVLATPATQVSVERAFSAFHFILSEKRCA